MAKKYHPDLNKGREDKFKEISEAYEVKLKLQFRCFLMKIQREIMIIWECLIQTLILIFIEIQEKIMQINNSNHIVLIKIISIILFSIKLKLEYSLCLWISISLSYIKFLLSNIIIAILIKKKWLFRINT